MSCSLTDLTTTFFSLSCTRLQTSVPAPGQIASPIRTLLAAQTNTSVTLGNVTGISTASKQVIVDANDKIELKISYDYLIIATGATHSYFGHDEFAAFAPGLKNLSDAESLRDHILEAFEKAEIEDDQDRQRELMTFVLVGAGPTGVEMASAIAVMARTTLCKDFRRIDPRSAYIVLAEMGSRPLASAGGNFRGIRKRKAASARDLPPVDVSKAEARRDDLEHVCVGAATGDRACRAISPSPS